MRNAEIQRELLKETRLPERALEVAIDIEMGIENQIKISGTAAHSTLNQAANLSVNSIQTLGTDPDHRAIPLSSL